MAPDLSPSPGRAGFFATERRWWICFLAAVLLLGAWIYHPVRHYGYLDFDDALFVRPLPALTHGLNEASVRWAFLANLTQYSPHVEYWCPLTVLSRLADVQLYGDNPGAFHLTSLFLHLANAALLALALRQFTGRLGPSLFVALLFAVHPLNAEVVCWLSARKDLVNAFFFFTTLLAYGWFVKKQTPGRYGLLLLAFVACLLAKPMGMTVPFLLLVLDFWPLRRWVIGESSPATVWRLIAEKIPLLLLALPIGYLAVVSQRDWQALVGTSRLPVSLRLINAVHSYALYLRRIFWPTDLCLFYPHPMRTLTAWQIGGAGAVLAVVTVGVWLARRRAPMFLAGWLWFGIVLGPVCGIMQLGSYGMADRYDYLAALGPIAAIAWWLADRWPPRWNLAAAGAILAVATGLSSAQALFWQDDLTAFTHAMLVTEGNYMAHENVALSLQKSGRVKDAYAHFQIATKINPTWATAWANLGEMQMEQGEDREAVRSFARSLQLTPTNLSAMLLVGRLERKLGEPVRAEAAFQHMLTFAPENPQAHLELGNLYADGGRWPEALEAWAAYLRVHPEDAEMQRRFAEATRNEHPEARTP
jgi:hypothetical protein